MSDSRSFDDGAGRVGNGLWATTYVPLTDVDERTGPQVLAALGRARIAAYLIPGAGRDTRQSRLYVAAGERSDARTIVLAAVRALANEHPEIAAADANAERDANADANADADPLAGIDTDAEFQALIAGWHVDTHEAVRRAERDLTKEDEDWRARLARPPADDPVWLDEDHYIPPPPPPLPRLATPTIVAMSVLAISILVLGLGGQVGLAGRLSLVLGIVGLLLGAGILFSRLHDARRDDEDDDGAAI